MGISVISRPDLFALTDLIRSKSAGSQQDRNTLTHRSLVETAAPRIPLQSSLWNFSNLFSAGTDHGSYEEYC